MQIPTSIITMLLGILITLFSLWYGQNHGLMPIAASDNASRVDELFNVMMTIGAGLFLLVEGALVVALVRFRRRKGDNEDGPHIEGNIPLEIVWTAIPAVIVLGISVYSFEIYTEMGGLALTEGPDRNPQTVQLAYATGDSHTSFPLFSKALSAAGLGEPPSLEGAVPSVSVDVNGLQYAFIFTYPDTGIIDGELHVPTGEVVKLNMKAQDVLHAFWLPEFRIKQDLIPGEETTLVFKANREGTYPVVCAELCGPYHGGMRTQMIVHSPEDYDEWVQSRVASGPSESVIAALSGQPRPEADYLSEAASALGMTMDAQALTKLHPADGHHPAHHHAHQQVAFTP